MRTCLILHTLAGPIWGLTNLAGPPHTAVSKTKSSSATTVHSSCLHGREICLMIRWVSLVVALATLPFVALGQGGGAKGPGSEEKPTEGIPITDPLVIAKCGSCHKKD